MLVTAGLAIEEFLGFKPKMYSYLGDGNSEHKKAKCVKKKCCFENNS